MFVNLEHVLPENPGDKWPDLTPELADAYARRLGNLALLSTKKNTDIGNESFAEKRKALADSEFVLTKAIGDCEKWGPAEIDARQAKLADLALSVWAYKV
jgi:3-methyladenine DNA glycosylase AlkD